MWEGACRKCRPCDVDSHKNIIESYFLADFEYDTIVSFLEKFHSIHISLSTLKRRLRDCGLKRRNPADLNQNGVIENNQRRVGWPKLHVWVRGLRLKYGLCIPRSTVQSLLKELDPVGTEGHRKHRLKQHIIKLSFYDIF